MSATSNASPAPQLLVGDRVHYQGQWLTVIDIDDKKNVRLRDDWIPRDDLEAVDDTGRWRHTGEQQ